MQCARRFKKTYSLGAVNSINFARIMFQARAHTHARTRTRTRTHARTHTRAITLLHIIQWMKIALPTQTKFTAATAPTASATATTTATIAINVCFPRRADHFFSNTNEIYHYYCYYYYYFYKYYY